MCNGSIMDKLISFSLPLMLSGILQLMFNAVDIIVVGRFSGKQALAAVGSTTALINVFTNLFIGISLGANVLAARFYAMGKSKEMSETVHTSITLAMVSGVIMAFVGVLFARGALELMGTPDDVIDQSTLYMRIYFMGMPFFMLYNYGAAILRAIGDTKRPLLFLIISGLINAALNMLLVIYCHMAVEGVAIATVISQLISCILVLWCLYKSEGSYQLRFSKLQIKGVYLKQIFQVGIPAGIQSMIINFSNVLLQSSVNSFGSTAMAGYTAANNILGFLYAAVNSITQACMSFTSQNYGVGKYKRMDKVLIDCLILTVVVAGVLGCGSYLLGPEILRIYTEEEKVIRCGMEILSITTVPYFLCGIMDLFPGALRGMGYSAVPMILSIIGTVGMRVVWIFGIFPHHRSLYVLFISYPGSWLFTIIMQVICFYFVRKKIHDVHPAARMSEPFLIKETAKLSDIIEITDFEDPKLDVYARTKEIQLLNRANPEDGIFIAESPKVVERALDAGYEPISILVEKRHVEGEAKQIIKRCGQIPVYTAEFDVLTKITGFKLTRGMLCAMHRRKLPSMREICENAKRIAVLEEVVNPTNIGAIFRSAAAMHMNAVLLTPACSNPLYRRAIRVSMGTVFQIPWTFVDNSVSWPEGGIQLLHKMGFKMAALALSGDSIRIDDPILQKEEKLAILLGTEGDGLTSRTIADCDYTVKIPMSHGVDSLNVAAASAVAFWQLRKEK